MWHALVVDDHPDICDVVKMGLETGNAFRVTCAANAEDALATLHRDRPDVAIIDVVMAGIGGLSLAKRALDLDIPVLLMTGARSPTRSCRRSTARTSSSLSGCGS